MDLLVWLLGSFSLAATVILSLLSIPKLERKGLAIAMVVVACSSGLGAGIIQAGLNHESERQTRDLLTGGTAFAYVAPQDHDPHFSLVLWNTGDIALQGVAVKIQSFNFEVERDVVFRELAIGTIPPKGRREMLPTFTPALEHDGTAAYWFMISATNGMVIQEIQFRRDKRGQLPWAYRYQVVRLDILGKPNEILMTCDWSDDVGGGKPTLPPN